MIAFVNGTLIEKTTDAVIVDVGGVGYELFIPLTTYYELPETGAVVALKVYTHHKEDAIQLYGFATAGEKALFIHLISVSGVGPKLARNILSGMPVSELATAIAGSDRARLSKIPGIGAKSAERLILELKDKVAAFAAMVGAGAGGPAAEPERDADAETLDAESALENLGYRPQLATEAVKKAREILGEGTGFEPLFKEALKLLSKR